MAIRRMTRWIRSGSDGASALVHISNGENGSDIGEGTCFPPCSPGGSVNPDTPNPAPPNDVFNTIGNPSGRLENGNVIRYSMWMKIDPNDPVIAPPQVEPIVKLEFWTEARSVFGDFNPGDNPTFGDRLYDTDQNGFCLFGDPGEVCPTFVDMDGDGFHSSGLNPDATLSTEEWTLVSTEYEVDDTEWGYSISGTFIPKTVSDVEEIRPVMFFGDFAGNNLTGTLLVDNPMLEIYRTAGDVPAEVPNPTPGPATVSGDFNGDNMWDCSDIDALVAEVAGMTGNLDFDMNGDNSLNFADVEEWLVVGGAQNPAQTGGGNPFLIGDANLDGVVDGLDFIEWNNSKFTATAAWCFGDFNADGIVDGLDFIDWNENKFTMSGDVVAVPEPAAAILLMLAGIGFVAQRRTAR
jgi:hypothetical protein